MVCPSCGNEIADNSIMCSVCGEAVVRRYNLDTNEFKVGGYDDSIASFSSSSSPKKSVNMTAIIIAAFLLIVAVGAGFFIRQNKQKKELHKFDGTYRFESVTTQGQTITTEEFQEAKYKTNEVCIIINGDTADFEGWEQIGVETMKGKLKVKIDGD